MMNRGNDESSIMNHGYDESSMMNCGNGESSMMNRGYDESSMHPSPGIETVVSLIGPLAVPDGLIPFLLRHEFPLVVGGVVLDPV